jgi:hypothetical protein
MRVTICEIDELRVFTGNYHDIEHEAAAPKGWVFAEPPALSSGEVAYWGGSGWVHCATPPEPITPVPEKITTLQAELQLIEDGLVQAVNDAIDALPEPERSKASAKWHNSRYIYREDTLVDQLLMGGVGCTKQQVDNMFIQASRI